MARKRAVPVEFMGDGERDWATFEVSRGYGTERLFAIKTGNAIAFGRTHGGSSVPRFNERVFTIALLKRVIEGGAPRPSGGRFRSAGLGNVTYITTCGERRTVSIAVLRAIVEDAEAIPAQ